MKRKLLIVLSAGALLVVGLYGIALLLAHRIVDDQLEALVLSGTYEQADYASLWLLPTGTMQVSGLHVRQAGNELVINDIEVSDIDFMHQTPWHMTLSATGLYFPNGLPDLSGSGNPVMAKALDEFGADNTIPLQLQYSYHYTPTNSEQIVYNMSLTLPDWLELVVATETRNLALESLQAIRETEDPEVAALLQQSALAAASLPHAKLHLTDTGIVAKLTELMAQRLGTAPDALREQLKSQMQNYHLFLPASLQGLAMQAGNELALFIDGGKTLSLTITPAYDGKLEQLQPEVMGVVLTGNFDRAVELLQLQIRTE